LELTVSVAGKIGPEIAADCEAAAGGRPVARGRIVLEAGDLEECFDPEVLRSLWRELHGPA
jgi:hypothetical protein